MIAQGSEIPFMKMHGLGNDFVVIDGRSRPVSVGPALARAIGDRHRGIGFDQLVIIRPCDDAEAELLFLNQDGSTAGACGNATRCVARHLMTETGKASFLLRTERGLLECADPGNGLTTVNMGAPLLTWSDIPLASDVDTLHLPMDGDPVATGMGNPHCTFFVEDADAIDLARLGAETERHPLFPQRTNVQFAHVDDHGQLRVRVWERGVGETLASGSSSCAVLVAAARRGLVGRKANVVLDGGTLQIEWAEDGVWMTGPTTHVCNGVLTPEFLALVRADVGASVRANVGADPA